MAPRPHATTPPDSTPTESQPEGSNDNAGDGTVTGPTAANGTEDGGRLVPVPVGCDAPDPPRVVFLGTVVLMDYRTVRFRIDQIRAGDPAPFAVDDQIDVRYGLDAKYLDVDEQYLVGAVVDPVLGLITSRVTPPIEDFGGDEVIGLAESDVDCPEFEDPERTLWPDGTEIDAGLLEPMLGSSRSVLLAILTPLGVAFGAIFGLALLRNSGRLAARAATAPRHRQPT